MKKSTLIAATGFLGLVLVLNATSSIGNSLISGDLNPNKVENLLSDSRDTTTTTETTTTTTTTTTTGAETLPSTSF